MHGWFLLTLCSAFSVLSIIHRPDIDKVSKFLPLCSLKKTAKMKVFRYDTVPYAKDIKKGGKNFTTFFNPIFRLS